MSVSFVLEESLAEEIKTPASRNVAGVILGDNFCYFSINVMLRWMKSERFLPLSIPFERSARSII